MAFRLSAKIAGQPRRFPLRAGRLEVGSAPDADIVLTDPSVSRRHAAIVVFGSRVEVEDLGSSNGTRLGSRRLQGRLRILPGSPLSFGGVEAVLEEVLDGDLELAFPLESPALSGPTLSGPTASAPPVAASSSPTASLDIWDRFAHRDLPALLNLLGTGRGEAATGAPPESFVQRLGSSLLAFPGCEEVEILEPDGSGKGVRRTRQTRYDGAEATERALTQRVPSDAPERDSDSASAASLWAGAEEGTWAVRLRFTHPVAAEICRPAAGVALELLRLARRPPFLRPASPSPAAAAPPLPAPATTDATVEELYGQAARVARGAISVLVQGESGTGKEVLARYLHGASPEALGPFVALHCGAIPEEMIEAELFGVEKGAATGVAERPGKFEEADGGVLFLDELGDLSPATQAKLLRALEEREVFRVGAKKARPARIRLISATQVDLRRRVVEGRFRLDLYHRLADWVAKVPPLRRRPGDIPRLAGHFLTLECQRHQKRIRGLSRAAVEALIAHDWPGNVRQLEREMGRVVLFVEDGQLLEASHLTAEIAAATDTDLATLLQREEERILREELAAAGGDVAQVATRLGISRATVYRRRSAILNTLEEDPRT